MPKTITRDYYSGKIITNDEIKHVDSKFDTLSEKNKDAIDREFKKFKIEFPNLSRRSKEFWHKSTSGELLINIGKTNFEKAITNTLPSIPLKKILK